MGSFIYANNNNIIRGERAMSKTRLKLYGFYALLGFILDSGEIDMTNWQFYVVLVIMVSTDYLSIKLSREEE